MKRCSGLHEQADPGSPTSRTQTKKVDAPVRCAGGKDPQLERALLEFAATLDKAG